VVKTFLHTDKDVRITVAAQSDVGRTREHNEDWFLVADLNTAAPASDERSLSCRIGPRGVILLVADGMGGAEAGEVASRMAAERIHDDLLSAWAADSDNSPEKFAVSLRSAIEGANRDVHARASSQADLRGMGTTLTLAGFMGEHVLLNQVGDSRAYRIRGQSVTQLTKDQSIVQELIDDGGLSEAEARQMVPKNVLLQALGPRSSVDVVQSWEPVANGDVFLLCSDGLSGWVAAADMAKIVMEAPDLTDACQKLIDMANDLGARDNVTVILARVDGEDPGSHAGDGS